MLTLAQETALVLIIVAQSVTMLIVGAVLLCQTAVTIEYEADNTPETTAAR